MRGGGRAGARAAARGRRGAGIRAAGGGEEAGSAAARIGDGAPIQRAEMGGNVYTHTVVVLRSLKRHVERHGYAAPIAFDDLLQRHANEMNRINLLEERAQSRGGGGGGDEVSDIRQRKLLTRRLYDVVSVMEAMDMIEFVEFPPRNKKNKSFVLKGRCC